MNKDNKSLEKEMIFKRESAWNKYNDVEKRKIFDFAEGYKDFLSKHKSERLRVLYIEESLKSKGFKNIEDVNELREGDKVYRKFKEKTIIAGVVGKNKDLVQLVGAHVDSPRLDLKPYPFTESGDLVYLKSHYYGGIKKYNWLNQPLSMYGVVYDKEGNKKIISIGDDENDPVFVIPDLIPHLWKKQREKKAYEVVEGEQMGILVGNIPVNDDKIKEKFKFMALKALYDKYGITERSFVSADIQFLPSGKARDLGFDRSMVLGYGNDDAVCVYATLKAIEETEEPNHIAIAYFSDKEEIGSYNNTGATGPLLRNFIEEMRDKLGLDIPMYKIFMNSRAISADVTSAINPNFPDVHDIQNSSALGRGVSVEKYGGAGGKFGTAEASVEYMEYILGLAEKNNISWQTGEISAIDVGGGGTIGIFMAELGFDVVDAGPSNIGMHTPFDIVSKVDLYESYKLYKVFLRD